MEIRHPPRRGRRAVSTQLRLFIWTEFSRDYTAGLAFAIAKDETEARQLIEKQRGYPVYDWGTLEVRRIDRRVARSVSGGG